MPNKQKNDKGNEESNDEIVVGRPPTTDEQYLINAAKLLQADKALERLDSHAKFLFSTVSIVGTLLTGFGLFSPFGASLLHNKWMLLPVGLACLSLAFAMAGLTPWVRHVRLNDLGSVQNYYNWIISYRGIFISLGSIFFALSLLSIAFVTVQFKPGSLTPAFSVRLAGTGEKSTLTTKVEFQEVPRFGQAETEVSGYYEDARKGLQKVILFRDLTAADTSGKITVLAELDNMHKYTRFEISGRVKSGTNLLTDKKVEIRR